MIEVLKQALEVIETAIKAGDWKVDGACDPDNVIYGLRQAIREHAMYEVQRLGQEIEQEPVAWMFEDSEDNGHKTFQSTPPSLEAVTYLAKWNRPTWMPLYTHPPQRKPLTDEQLKNHYQNNEWLDGVRFAEQFHGIKE